MILIAVGLGERCDTFIEIRARQGTESAKHTEQRMGICGMVHTVCLLIGCTENARYGGTFVSSVLLAVGFVFLLLAAQLFQYAE